MMFAVHIIVLRIHFLIPRISFFIITKNKHRRENWRSSYSDGWSSSVYSHQNKACAAVCSDCNYRLGILSPLAYKRNHGMPHAKGGYTDRKDCKWSATTIIRILQDETYTGTLVQGKQTTPHFKLKEREDKPSSEWIRVEGTHEAIIQKHDFEKELTVALGMSLPLFQLEARQKQEKDKLKIQMSAKRQEIEKTRRLIRGLYENFVQGILTNDEYFELKADYEYAINALSGEIEVFEKSMDSLDNQLARYRAMEKDAKTLAQDHVLTAELIERLIERIEIDHERNIHVTFRFKNEFQGKAVELCATM